MDQTVEQKIAEIATYLTNKKLKLATVESCTGGGLSYVFTNLPGSSNWFELGLITYSNEAKIQLVGVDEKTIANFGAVSEQTAIQMVDGLLAKYSVDIGISVTGIAGPDGGSEEKPIGTVWIAWKIKGKNTITNVYHFQGDRKSIREQSILAAIKGLSSIL